MKKVILVLIVMLFCAGANAQIKKTADGNYIQQKRSTTDSTSLKDTGKTFINYKGKTFLKSKGEMNQVYLSEYGYAFVIRTSKTGNKYREYIELD